MAHKPKYAKQEPRRNTALKLLPLVLVAIVAVVLIVRSLGKGKPDDAPTTPQQRKRLRLWSRSPPPP